jgi:hypothetical protein
MRLSVDLVQRETLRAGEEAPARLLATAGLEWLDRRDAEWWPFVRLPPLRLDAGNVEALVAGLRDVLQGAAPGFAWQSGEPAAFGAQIGAVDGGALVEIGLDLGAFLADASGLPPRGGGELALFRFQVASPDVVRFAAELEAQLRGLLAP